MYLVELKKWHKFSINDDQDSIIYNIDKRVISWTWTHFALSLVQKYSWYSIFTKMTNSLVYVQKVLKKIYVI